MNRIEFLKSGFVSAIGIGVIPTTLKGQDSPPPIKVEIVKEFVIAGHGNPTKVKEMLQTYPNLLYSRYDWGNGDFEEAIEGAAHVGNREIAEFLIQQGARLNLFALTMLGKTDLVIPVLDQYPNLVFAKGAHGLTLLHHAKVGGKDSERIFQYLAEKGLKETQVPIK
jgi:hypothetical protein